MLLRQIVQQREPGLRGNQVFTCFISRWRIFATHDSRFIH